MSQACFAVDPFFDQLNPLCVKVICDVAWYDVVSGCLCNCRGCSAAPQPLGVKVPMSRDAADPDELALPEWVFTRHMPSLIERLRTELGGATFAAKIFKTSSSAAVNKDTDNEVVDVTDLLVPKKKKRTNPKAKAKGKAKAAAQADDEENPDEVLADVQQSSGCSRKRWWIDDVLAALIHAAGQTT